MSRIVRIVSQPWTPTRVGDELELLTAGRRVKVQALAEQAA